MSTAQEHKMSDELRQDTLPPELVDQISRIVGDEPEPEPEKAETKTTEEKDEGDSGADGTDGGDGGSDAAGDPGDSGTDVAEGEADEGEPKAGSGEEKPEEVEKPKTKKNSALAKGMALLAKREAEFRAKEKRLKDQEDALSKYRDFEDKMRVDPANTIEKLVGTEAMMAWVDRKLAEKEDPAAASRYAEVDALKKRIAELEGKTEKPEVDKKPDSEDEEEILQPYWDAIEEEIGTGKYELISGVPGIMNHIKVAAREYTKVTGLVADPEDIARETEEHYRKNLDSILKSDLAKKRLAELAGDEKKPEQKQEQKTETSVPTVTDSMTGSGPKKAEDEMDDDEFMEHLIKKREAGLI